MTGPDGPTYEDGEQLGCPDCAAAEPHVCPFLWADQQPEPARSWALAHMQGHLSDEIDQTHRPT